MPLTNNFKSELQKRLPSGPQWTSSNPFSEILHLSSDRSRSYLSAKTPDTFSDRKLWLSKLCVCQNWLENNFVGHGCPYSLVRILSYFDILFNGSFRVIQSGQYKVNVVLSIRTIRAVRLFEDDPGFISSCVKVFDRKTQWRLLRVLIGAFELA